MFGTDLKKLRMQRGMSQEDIAEKLYVVRQTVSKWENGQSSPSVEQLIQLSTVLDVTIGQLLERNDKVTSNQYGNKCLAITKKAGMITAITNRLEGLNEAGVEVLFDIVMLLPDRERWKATTTPERIAELDAIKAQHEQEAAQAKEKENKEARQKEAEKRNQVYLEHARMFNAIKTVDIPTRYDLCVEEIRAIDFVCGGVSRCFPEYSYSVAGKYFHYGFVKGMRCAKAQAKKKQQKKKASSSID